MKKFVRIISLLMVLVMCISAAACGNGGDDTSMNNDKIVDSRTKVGDRITLGKYEQDGDVSAKEDIVWIVLKVEEGRALLISEKCLTYSGFHDAYEEFGWTDFRE